MWVYRHTSLSLFLNAPHNIKYENMNKNKGGHVSVYAPYAACRQFAATNISSGLETPPPQIIILLRSLSAGKAISAAGHPSPPDQNHTLWSLINNKFLYGQEQYQQQQIAQYFALPFTLNVVGQLFMLACNRKIVPIPSITKTQPITPSPQTRSKSRRILKIVCLLGLWHVVDI